MKKEVNGYLSEFNLQIELAADIFVKFSIVDEFEKFILSVFHIFVSFYL